MVALDAPRQDYSHPALAPGDQRFADEEPRRSAVALSDEVSPVGHVEIRRYGAARAVPLYSLGIVDGDHPQLRYSGGAIREDFIETLGRDLAAVVLVPTRRIPEQQIDALPSPRGLLGERRRDIADFAIGRSERIAVGTRSVVSGGGRKRKYDKQAKHRDPEPQALEPDGGGGLRNEIVGWGHASRRALIRWTDHSANGREQSIAGQRLGAGLGHAERLRRRTGTREAGAEWSRDRHHRSSRVRCANFIHQAAARKVGHINTDHRKIHIIGRCAGRP